MKTVLVLGGTGAMGRYLVPELAGLGYAVTAVGIEENPPKDFPAAYIQGNAFDKEFVKQLLQTRYDGIVNFMNYGGDRHFYEVMDLFLQNTDHYIFTSSCRVYDDKEQPIKETSPRLLDSSEDMVLRASGDYCIHKARDEDRLANSQYRNWSVIRPATTFSTMRLQLTTLEFEDCVGRALMGKKVILPIQCQDKPATLSWGGDVAAMIARILFKEEAMGECYNVCSAEYQTWGQIAEYYKELVGLEAIWVDKEEYLAIINPEGKLWPRRQLEYGRMFHRITDNSKVLKLTGLKQEDLMPMYEGLKMEIGNIPKGYVPKDSERGLAMDAYIKEHNL